MDGGPPRAGPPPHRWSVYFGFTVLGSLGTSMVM